MDYGLAGKVAVVTGAGKGIGLAVTTALAAEGVRVVAGSRSVTPELAALDNVEPVAIDLSTAVGPAQLVAAAGTRVDILVNNVGSAPVRTAGFLGVTEDQWLSTLNLNLLAAIRASRAVLPPMLAAGGGSIVTVSSWFGRTGHGYFSAYCASKAALISLTHSAAAELAADKIRVNSVAPGNVATSMHFTALREEAEKRGISFEEMKKIEWDKIPLGRAADPAEIASAIAFLASMDGNYLTGATIDVNGGVLFS